jgi:hypothetical protein
MEVEILKRAAKAAFFVPKIIFQPILVFVYQKYFISLQINALHIIDDYSLFVPNLYVNQVITVHQDEIFLRR